MRPIMAGVLERCELDEMLLEAEDEVVYLKQCIHELDTQQAFWNIKPILLKLDLYSDS